MEAVVDFRPEALICDIAMPEEDGYTFIRKRRASGAAHGATIPALAFTALAGDEDRKRALAAGFQQHMAKPVELDLLIQAVAELSHRKVEGGRTAGNGAGAADTKADAPRP